MDKSLSLKEEKEEEEEEEENAVCMTDCISSYVLNNAVPITVDLVKPGMEYKIFLGKVTIFFFNLLNLELVELLRFAVSSITVVTFVTSLPKSITVFS